AISSTGNSAVNSTITVNATGLVDLGNFFSSGGIITDRLSGSAPTNVNILGGTIRAQSGIAMTDGGSVTMTGGLVNATFGIGLNSNASLTMTGGSIIGFGQALQLRDKSSAFIGSGATVTGDVAVATEGINYPVSFIGVITALPGLADDVNQIRLAG